MRGRVYLAVLFGTMSLLTVIPGVAAAAQASGQPDAASGTAIFTSNPEGGGQVSENTAQAPPEVRAFLVGVESGGATPAILCLGGYACPATCMCYDNFPFCAYSPNSQCNISICDLTGCFPVP